MKLKPNPLCLKMVSIYKDKTKDGGKVIICNEGGSRSGKTWSAFYFIYLLCDANRGTNLDIYILRDTLINCRDKTLLDFQHFMEGMGEWNEKNLVAFPKPVYNLFGQKLRFRGLDDEEGTEGYPSDIVFVNEALDCNESGIRALRMRNKKVMILDWNPKFTDAEVFNYAKRDDTVFTKSTYLDNKDNLPFGVIQEIEGFNPDIPENVENGTADLFRWKVYGLGERANKEGLVFPDVIWIDEFPKDIEEISYGMDFGETAQTAITKVGIRRKESGKHDLFIEGLFYSPTENSDLVYNVITKLKEKEPIQHIWCDNNQPGWVRDLRAKNPPVVALCTKKFQGSREYWITSIKKFNIHMVKNPDLRREQENFCYRVVDGVQLSETIKKHDHYLSSAGYATVGEFRFEKQTT
jgi:phage terminase large subunit